MDAEANALAADIEEKILYINDESNSACSSSCEEAVDRGKVFPKGKRRRLLGATQALLTSVVLCASTFSVAIAHTMIIVAATPAIEVYQGIKDTFTTEFESRPDLLEVFASHATVSSCFVQQGRIVSEPWDILCSNDL